MFHGAADLQAPTSHSFCQACVCRWWLQGDSPWQLLAVCKDLRNALACACPEAYLSRLPVHQDGSCNGLQHYAALSRDESGGRAVNLAPVDRPQVGWTAHVARTGQAVALDYTRKCLCCQAVT